MKPHARHAARWSVVDDNADYLLLRDEGPWHDHMTITNDAEQVVASLTTLGAMPTGTTRRLYYYDSENNLTELLMRDGRFLGFKDTTILP